MRATTSSRDVAIDATSTGLDRSTIQRPVALLHGPGLLIVYGNPPFLEAFGRGCLGLPASEAMIGLPGAAFDAMAVSYREGRPVGCGLAVADGRLRLTVVPRRDIETGDVYGVAIRLAPERDTGP